MLLPGSPLAALTPRNPEDDEILAFIVGRFALLLLALMAAYALVSLGAFLLLKRLRARGRVPFELGYRLGRLGRPWEVLADWWWERRLLADLPKCCVCRYRIPLPLAGAVFMGPGGLGQCPRCQRTYCNDHAKRIPFDSITLLNCPKCGEALDRV